jgi:hypothetical protein
MQRPARRLKRKRVFVSFDHDNDVALRNFIVGQARLGDSPFEVVDHSLKGTAPEALWERKAGRDIARSDIVFVMLGRRARFAPGVLKEVRMARSTGKPIFQIMGYRNGSRAWRIAGAGRVYL